MEQDKLLSRLEFLHDRVTLLEKRFGCIQNIASALGSSLHMDEVLHTVADQVTAMLDAERATVFLVDEETNNLVARTIIGTELQRIELRPGQGIAGWVAQTGRTLNVKDAYRDKRFDPSFDAMSGFRTRSILCQPMVTYRGKIVGVIQVLNKKDGYFTVEDEHLLSTITTQATISIDNSKYYSQLHETNLQLTEAQENLQRNYGRLETLFNIQNQLMQTWERHPLIRGTLRELTVAIPCQVGAVLLCAPAPNALFVQYRGRENVDTIYPSMTGGVLGAVVGEGRSVREARDGAGLLPILHPQVDTELLSLTAEPLTRTDGTVIGALALANRVGLLNFSAEDAQIVKIVARLIATAIERLEQHDRLTRENNLALIGTALSGVLHDLRSPMSVIAGFVQLMEAEEEPDKRHEQAEEVLKQFQHINSMTREVLAFARGEANLLKRSIYPQKFLGEMEQLLRQEFAGRNVKLVVENACREKFKADEGKLKRLFFNIARNARDAMPDGGTFRIRAAQENHSVLFELSDTGHGIPEEIRENLFQSFVTTGKKEGTGLGLAIVKKIVDQHGGTVDFTTKTGQGTTFTIRLPRE